jgi:hypothetical protein
LRLGETSGKGVGVRSPFRIVGESCRGVLLSRPFERRDFVRAARGDVDKWAPVADLVVKL